jgi:hypothetical protein
VSGAAKSLVINDLNNQRDCSFADYLLNVCTSFTKRGRQQAFAHLLLNKADKAVHWHLITFRLTTHAHIPTTPVIASQRYFLLKNSGGLCFELHQISHRLLILLRQPNERLAESTL